MPLQQSKSKGAFKSNLQELLAAGYPQKQALAISYSVARKNGGKDAKKGQKK